MVAEGQKLKFDAVNAAGGVKMGDGKTRKIDLIIEDDGLDPQRTLANVRKMVEKDQVFALVGTAATPNNLAIGRYITQKKVPNVFMLGQQSRTNDGQRILIWPDRHVRIAGHDK